MIDLSLLEDFVMGAGESLEEMESALLTLESSPNDVELLNTIFRAIHTIKGAAQFVGLEKVSALSHSLEDLLDLLREGKKQATPDIINILIQAKDRISKLTSDLERSQTEETEVDDLVQALSLHLDATADNLETISPSTDDLLSTFLPKDEDEEDDGELSLFLSEDTPDENTENFLEEGSELDAFLSEDKPNEDKTFLSDNELESLLSEDDSEIDSFLLNEPKTTEEPESNASFLLGTEDDFGRADIDSLLHFSEEKVPITAPIDTNAHFILPSEEHDQELFEIFILQLREKFVFLNNHVVQLETSYSNKKAALLEQILEILESLKFSANYMAYEKLTDFYSHWIDAILSTQKNLLKIDAVSFRFMRENLLELQTIFPQLQVETIHSKKSEVITEAPDNITMDVSDESLNGELAFIDEMITQNEAQESTPVKSPKPNAAEKVDKIDVGLSSDASDGFDVKKPRLENDLFHKLSTALDASVIEQAIISEPINEVFSALLDSTEKQRQQAKTNETRDLILDVKTLKEVNTEASAVLPESAKETPIPKVATKTPMEVEAPKLKPEQKIPLQKKTASPKITETAPSKKVFKKSIRVDADKIDALMNQVGELIVDRAYFFQLATEISKLQQLLKASGVVQKDLKLIRTFAYRYSEAILSLGRTSNALQENVMKIRMLPMTQLFNRFPRLVHDVANTNHKKVFLNVLGEETELDKMIIEEIADPLMHMIRNAIDHGIERPEDRLNVGKPETGKITLEAYNESNHIVIEITDDGRGIDIEKIKDKAERMELFTRQELNRMSANDLTRFIMMPGFSTAKEVSSTSGRGVGMDVVKKNIEKLNGTIDVESKKGIETKMRLKIPLTLAIIPALLVKVAEDPFTIPLANVEETLRVQQSDISIIEETEVMYLRGKTIPIFRLATLFMMKSPPKIDEDDFFVVIVNTGTQKIGLMVDSLIGQDEVVIKPLADYLYEQNCFSGATIIGDGRVSLIIDVYELVAMTTTKVIDKHHQQEKKSLAVFTS